MFTNENKFNEPIFSISTAARILNISVHTLRMYEREGLFISFKNNSNQRLFSQSDIERIQCIRTAINEAGISISGIKTIYSLIPCWKIKGCLEEDRKKCDAYNNSHVPCWSYEHKNFCKDKNCRECEVYYKYSQCGAIKELIKSISR